MYRELTDHLIILPDFVARWNGQKGDTGQGQGDDYIDGLYILLFLACHKLPQFLQQPRTALPEGRSFLVSELRQFAPDFHDPTNRRRYR